MTEIRKKVAEDARLMVKMGTLLQKAKDICDRGDEPPEGLTNEINRLNDQARQLEQEIGRMLAPLTLAQQKWQMKHLYTANLAAAYVKYAQEPTAENQDLITEAVMEAAGVPPVRDQEIDATGLANIIDPLFRQHIELIANLAELLGQKAPEAEIADMYEQGQAVALSIGQVLIKATSLEEIADITSVRLKDAAIAYMRYAQKPKTKTYNAVVEALLKLSKTPTIHGKLMRFQ